MRLSRILAPGAATLALASSLAAPAAAAPSEPKVMRATWCEAYTSGMETCFYVHGIAAAESTTPSGVFRTIWLGTWEEVSTRDGEVIETVKERRRYISILREDAVQADSYFTTYAIHDAVENCTYTAHAHWANGVLQFQRFAVPPKCRKQTLIP